MTHSPNPNDKSEGIRKCGGNSSDSSTHHFACECRERMFENALKAADSLALALRFRMARPEAMPQGDFFALEQVLTNYETARAKVGVGK